MAVTIKDIAKLANVSHPTVSRALRDDAVVSAETRRRVQAIAAELGYVPNTVARGLKMSRSGVLGVMIGEIVDPFFSEVLRGIEDVLYAQDYRLFLAASKRDPERERVIFRTMSEHRVDGMIICSTEVGADHLAQLARLKVPSVLINNQAVEETAVFSVYHNDVEGSRQLTEHLLRLGHTRIGFLGNGSAGKTNLDRQAGYLQAMAMAGLPVADDWLFDAADGEAQDGFLGVSHFLALSPEPTALVCFNDLMAIGAIRALQASGRQVPDFCSVVGFDNIDLADFLSPPLTTFHQPKFELGQTAARMMLAALNSPEEANLQPDVRVLLGELRLRASTAVPRGA